MANDSHVNILNDRDPEPYITTIKPNFDWIIVCDHASNLFPEGLRNMVSADLARTHIAWDIGASDLSVRLAERLDAPLLRSNYSRLVIDCNRYPDAEDAMPAESDGHVIAVNAALDSSQKQARVREIFIPYQRAVAAMIETAIERGKTPVLLSIHSCNPAMGGKARPWDVGIGWTRDPRTALPILDRLKRLGTVNVGDNQPYALDLGFDFTVPEQAMARGLAHVQVEFRNDLIATIEGARRFADLFHDVLMAAHTNAWHRRENYLLPSDGISGSAVFNSSTVV